MATAVSTHEYREAIDTKRTFVRTGQGSLFWGLITWPTGYVRENLKHWGVCVRCGEKEFTPAHGFHSATKFA